MMRNNFRIAIAAGLFAMCLPALRAQTAAKIIGTVVDQDARPVPGASIDTTGQNTAAKRKLTADKDGNFILNELPPDSYQINATCDTCNDVSSIVDVGAGQTRSVTLKLNTKSTSTEISVDKHATTMETTSARLGYNVTAPEIAALPVNGLTYAPLTLTAPFVSNSGGAAPDDLRIAGQSRQENRYRLDGIDMSSVASASPEFTPAQGVDFRLRTSVATIQEFRVDSAMTLAEDGFATGGQIKLVSRGGTDQWHAGVFEYLRNDKLDARNFFETGATNELRMNQFGGDAGGAVRKDKLFVFGSFEKLLQTAGLNILESVPSAGARSAADPSISPVLQLIPVGSSTGDPDVNIANRQAKATQSESNLNFRIDYLLNLKNRYFARYSRSNGSAVAPDQSVTARNIAAATRPDQFVLGWSAELSGSLMNQLTAGLNRVPTSVSVDGGSALLAGYRLIASGGSDNTTVSPGGLIQMVGGGYGSAADYRGRTWNLVDHLDWLRGAHSIKTGIDYRALVMPFQTTGGTTYRYLNLDNLVANTDADTTYSPDLPLRVAQAKQFGAFIQDEWRLRSNLTLSFGLRYEYFSPTSEQQNRASFFDLSTFTLQPVQGGFYQASKLGFAPRAAVAWSPDLLKGNTVFRAGAGIYQGPTAILDTIQPIQNGAVPVFLGGAFFPQTPQSLLNDPGAARTPYAMDGSSFSHPQRNMAFSASVQQALPGQMVAQIGYLGLLSRHLSQQGTTNLATAVDPETGDRIRPNDQFSAIQYLTNGGNSSYNALQLGLSRRLVNGPTVSASYNWAHSIGDSLGTGETQAAQNPTCLACERASNNFDIRNTFSLNSVYELPFGRNRKYLKEGFMGALAAGWSLAGEWNLHSGLPVNVLIERSDEIYLLNGVYYSPYGNIPDGAVAVTNVPYGGEDRGAERPNRVAGVNPYVNKAGTLFLNPAAFSIPLPGTMGNLGRNALRGPGFSQIDLQISRTFQIGEKQRFILRAEAFNLANHVNFANPTSVLPDTLVYVKPGAELNTDLASAFGQLNSTVGRTVGLGTSRQLQVSIRYQF